MLPVLAFVSSTFRPRRSSPPASFPPFLLFLPSLFFEQVLKVCTLSSLPPSTLLLVVRSDTDHLRRVIWIISSSCVASQVMRLLHSVPFSETELSGTSPTFLLPPQSFLPFPPACKSNKPLLDPSSSFHLRVRTLTRADFPSSFSSLQSIEH